LESNQPNPPLPDEISGANPFRVRAYRAAACTIGSLSQDVAESMAEEEPEGNWRNAGFDGGTLAMLFKEFLVSVAVALSVCVVYTLSTRSSVRRTGFGWFFLFVLITTWAGGVWLRPFGPSWGEIRWLQFMIVGLVVVLLFALFAPLKAPRGRHETLDQIEEIARQKELEKVTYVTLGVVFWVVLAILLVAIVIRYVVH
jgi:hypothetical protein